MFSIQKDKTIWSSLEQALDIFRITQIHQKEKYGDQTLFTNYRPISVFPCFSKFRQERIIYSQIFLRLNNFNILYDNQYGFRRNHSTSLVPVALYDKISLALDPKEIAAGAFIDLSKAIPWIITFFLISFNAMGSEA